MTVCHSGRFCNGQPQGGILTGAHGVAPAGHEALGASGGTAGGQGHGLHVLVEGGGLAQLDQHDVVVDVVGAVVGVADGAGGFDELLISLSHSDVVLAHANLNTAERQEKGIYTSLTDCINNSLDKFTCKVIHLHLSVIR